VVLLFFSCSKQSPCCSHVENNILELESAPKYTENGHEKYQFINNGDTSYIQFLYFDFEKYYRDFEYTNNCFGETEFCTGAMQEYLKTAKNQGGSWQIQYKIHQENTIDVSQPNDNILSSFFTIYLKYPLSETAIKIANFPMAEFKKDSFAHVTDTSYLAANVDSLFIGKITGIQKIYFSNGQILESL